MNEINVDRLATVIEQALIRKGWSQHDLARATKISQSSISGYLARQKTPRRKTTKRLLEVLDLSWRDIGIDVPEVEVQRPSTPPTTVVTYGQQEDRQISSWLSGRVVLVPRSRWGSAGSGQTLYGKVRETKHDDDYDPYPRDELARLSGSNPDQLCSAVVVGDSLAPELAPNTRVIYLPVDRFTGDGLYVVKVDDDEVVKRVQVLPGGTLCFLPINPAYRPVELTPLPEAATPHTYRVVGTSSTSVITPRGKVVIYSKTA